MGLVNTITIRELNTPESRAMKYIATKLGLNLSPDKAVFDEAQGVYRVAINAIVPNRVTRGSGASKTFFFRFQNVGEIMFDGQLNLMSASTASEIDDRISEKFWSIYGDIEKDILKAGTKKWGKLVFVHTFLRPIYSIVTHILTRKCESIELLNSPKLSAYSRILMEDKYLEFSQDDPRMVIPGNKLTMLHRLSYEREGETVPALDLFQVAENVVGDIFSRRFRQLIQDQGLRPLSAYVDLTKAYYADAISVGERIAIPQQELFQKYRRFINRPVDEAKIISFSTLVSELVAANLLAREEDKVTGDQTLFENLLVHRESILREADVLELGTP